MMTYKGYTASIEFDQIDKIFVGRVDGIKTLIGFHADTAQALEVSFHQSINHYLATCKKLNKPAEKPYSGKFLVRMTPNQHAKLASKSKKAGQSLNAFVLAAVDNRI